MSDYKKTNSNRKANTTNISERRAKGALLLCRIVDFHVVHHSLDVLLTMQHGPAPSQGCRLDLSLKPTTHQHAVAVQRSVACAQAGRACAVGLRALVSAACLFVRARLTVLPGKWRTGQAGHRVGHAREGLSGQRPTALEQFRLG